MKKRQRAMTRLVAFRHLSREPPPLGLSPIMALLQNLGKW
jgi:hypothetical protein